MTTSKRDIAFASVYAVTRVSRTKLLSKARPRPIVETRQLLILVLSHDGFKDEHIGFILNRHRPAICLARQRANKLASCSKVFNDKLKKTIRLYDNTWQQIRLSEN